MLDLNPMDVSKSSTRRCPAPLGTAI
jgi:hypothetical protein